MNSTISASLTVISVNPDLESHADHQECETDGIDDAGGVHAGEHVGQPDHAEPADQAETAADENGRPAEHVEHDLHHRPPKSSPDRRPRRLYLKNFMMAIVVMKLISA